MVNPLSNPFYLLTPLIVACIIIVLMISVWRKSRRDFSSRIFSGLLLSLGLWSLLTFGMRSSPDVHQALIWEKAIIVAGFTVFVFYYHFTLAYTNATVKSGIILAIYSLLAVVAALAFTDLLVEGMRLEAYGYAPITRPLSFPLFAAGPLLIVGGIYNLLKRYKVSLSYEERNRLLYLTIAALFPILGGGLDAFSNLPPLAIWGNLVFCIICSIAILKYHLLDIRVAIRKSTAFFVMSAIVAIPYVGIIFLSTHVFSTQPISVWVYLLLLVILALALQPLWSQVQRRVDRWFYRQRYDFLRELEDFSQEAHDIGDLNQLSSSLVKLISRALQSSSVYLLLSSSSGHFTTVCSAGEETSQLTIESRSPLLRWLRSNEGVLHRKALDTIPQLQSLTTKEANELKKVRAKLFIPLKTKERQLVGMLIISEKLSEQPYSEEDERLIVSVASRVAVELENTRLYASEKSMRKELQRQNEQKTEFLHSVAHELKTPLTAIISSSELLSTEPLSATISQRQRLIQNIAQSAWTMDGRVTQLLDFAKMQVEDLKIKPQLLEIDLIIKEVASRFLVLFQNKEQSLKLEIPDSLPQVKADRQKLEQILVNLLSNANKFSPTGGNITLRVREDGNRIVVEVKDSAPAIPEGEKAKLFDPYYRGEDADKKQHFPGLGLGLAISRKLVELHQGEIWVDSKPRKGNTFAFSLPALEQGAKGIG